MPTAPVKQQLLRTLDRLPEDRLQEVLDYVEFLLSKEERHPRSASGPPEPAQDPLLQLAGSLDAEPFAHQIDEELYGR